MSPSPGIIKGRMFSFVLGIGFGFCFTYLTLNFSGYNLGAKRQKTAQFIPRDPHSHGQMDSYVGPEKAQNWKDFDEENHKGIEF